MEAWTKETWITKGNTEAIFHHSTSVLRRDIFVPTINLQSAKCSQIHQGNKAGQIHLQQ